MKADRLQGQLDRCVLKYMLHVKLNYSRNIFIARQKSTKPYRHVCMSSNVSSSNGIDQLNEKKKNSKITSKIWVNSKLIWQILVWKYNVIIYLSANTKVT